MIVENAGRIMEVEGEVTQLANCNLLVLQEAVRETLSRSIRSI
jgi:hypothetical protein